ncbi:MAG: N4-gp56 family major capsid protein [Clostridia bacterium]|nr:N4-gp56 family major capsid protein [Clostridia bacterium]
MKKYLKFNLQLFADPNPNVQTTGSADLTPEMKEYYNTLLLKLMQANLVHTQFGKKDSIPKNGGKTILYRMYSAFPAVTEALEEGITPDGVPLKVTEISKTLEEFGAYTTLSDVLILTAIDNNIKEATEKHADSAVLTLDRIARNELNAGTNVVYAAKDGVRATSRSQLTAEHQLTYTDVAYMSTMLKRNNAPTIDGSYIAIVHPDVAQDIMLDERWIDVQKYKNPENVYNGEIGKLHNVRFIDSTEALCVKEGAEGCGVYSTLFLGRDGYHVIDVGGAGVEIIVKPAGSSGTADPLNQRSTVGWKVPMFGVKRTIEQYIWRFESGSSLSNMAIANN